MGALNCRFGSDFFFSFIFFPMEMYKTLAKHDYIIQIDFSENERFKRKNNVRNELVMCGIVSIEGQKFRDVE